MNDETTDTNTNYLKLKTALDSNIKVHISLVDNTWRNGYVVELFQDFMIFQDEVNTEESIFLLEIIKISPYIKSGRAKDVDRN